MFNVTDITLMYVNSTLSSNLNPNPSPMSKILQNFTKIRYTQSEMLWEVTVLEAWQQLPADATLTEHFDTMPKLIRHSSFKTYRAYAESEGFESES